MFWRVDLASTVASAKAAVAKGLAEYDDLPNHAKDSVSATLLEHDTAVSTQLRQFAVSECAAVVCRVALIAVKSWLKLRWVLVILFTARVASKHEPRKSKPDQKQKKLLWAISNLFSAKRGHLERLPVSSKATN